MFNKFASEENVLVGHSFGSCQVARVFAAAAADKESEMKAKINACILIGTAGDKQMNHSVFRW